MLRLFFLFSVLILFTGKIFAQDTIVFNGQPNWKTGVDIADHCLFYEENVNKALSFEAVKKQSFLSYKKAFRQQKFSNRPLIIQWLKFTIRNISGIDTLTLRLSTIHYYTRLYIENELIARSGAYEVNGIENPEITTAFDRGRLPVVVGPASTITYWLRTEDRQNQLIPPPGNTGNAFHRYV